MRHGVAAATVLATISLVSTALASEPDDFVTFGMSMSVKLCCSPGGAVGFGPAINYAHWLRGNAIGNYSPTIGAFGWLHYYPAPGSTRLGLGPQASYLFGGIELGPSVMLAGETTNVTASLTPFLSGGFVWVGVRLNMVDPHKQDALLEFVTGAGYPIGASAALRTGFR